jgi:aldehyde:ferredoxin oxidoreductase
MGWDEEGRPLAERLRALGLSEVGAEMTKK